MSDLEAEVEGLKIQLTNERRARCDRDYMITALVQMLGSNGLAVWNAWQAKGVQRVHYSWGPEAHKMTGEERAAVLLEWEEAMKNAEPVEDLSSW